ncbi:L-aminoadipate-semialdehyde dehydrogenase-phosphopantetheinyl transferase [Dirofilaria immitis]|nr:L-aminoadipate-semialdehyde dehydrogenase-phosphopantetheinyl transferase [Dirofilaria immitis]
MSQNIIYKPISRFFEVLAMNWEGIGSFGFKVAVIFMDEVIAQIMLTYSHRQQFGERMMKTFLASREVKEITYWIPLVSSFHDVVLDKRGINRLMSLVRQGAVASSMKSLIHIADKTSTNCMFLLYGSNGKAYRSLMMQARDCKCHRLAVSLNETLNSLNFEANFRKAVQSLTSEECAKAARFRFKDDALASILGRLFLRQPYLMSPSNTKYGFNVSHQGDYVAFASSCSQKVGVDCMRLHKERNNKSADDYITSMAKSAGPEELRMMRSQATDQMKMIYFYRYWCLKEAVLKATGEGLLQDLSRLNFHIEQKERYRPRCFITSTTVSLDGELQDEWMLEETFIDEMHNVAVCREKRMPSHCLYSTNPDTRIYFGFVDISFLLEGTAILNPLPEDGAAEWMNFNAKPRKIF